MTIHLGPPAGGTTAAGDLPEPAVAEGSVGPEAPAGAVASAAPAAPAGPASDRPRHRRRWPLPAALVALLVAAVAAWAGAHRAGADPRVRTVVVTMHHSRFQPAAITVPPGATVRFVLRNTDPIDHEFIIGGKVVHQLHERGTQRSHHGPGEVSVPAGQQRTTTVSFNLTAGELEYACHLPGHYAYGMRGLVTIVS
ncbi:MAG TPA: cupredoxin domain-containing protein [Actinomycetota bacterium]|jgi:uncharacterized cupredoxin-like copper-binding protein